MKARVSSDIFGSADNRRITITAGEIKEQFNKEFEARKDELFEAIKADIIPQLMATCLVELDKEFGFRKVRLNRFYAGVNDLFNMMPALEFNTVTCIDYIKDKYGIDVEVNNDK